MWSVLVLFLGPKYGFKPEDKFLLTIVPALVGSPLRLPYTFAVATFGGRNWTVVSALLLLVPSLAMLAVVKPGVSLDTLLVVAALVAGSLAAAAASVLSASLQKLLPLFLVGFCALFVFSGIGNGSTYKLISAIFRARSQLKVDDGAEPAVSDREARRLSGALIGVASAIAAFGGVLGNVAFQQSFLDTKEGNAAYVAFLALYAVCFVLTWVVYLRPSSERLVGVCATQRHFPRATHSSYDGASAATVVSGP